MTTVIKIGNLSLGMGSVSHALGVTKNSIDTYLKYVAYQSKFEKGSK